MSIICRCSHVDDRGDFEMCLQELQCLLSMRACAQAMHVHCARHQLNVNVDFLHVL